MSCREALSSTVSSLVALRTTNKAHLPVRHNHYSYSFSLQTTGLVKQDLLLITHVSSSEVWLTCSLYTLHPQTKIFAWLSLYVLRQQNVSIHQSTDCRLPYARIRTSNRPSFLLPHPSLYPGVSLKRTISIRPEPRNVQYTLL